jgi:hypothetical protein
MQPPTLFFQDVTQNQINQRYPTESEIDTCHPYDVLCTVRELQMDERFVGLLSSAR